MFIYYSVRNGGDGSAYPTFMSSQALAEWDQEHMDEGWGESCDGSLEIKGDNIKVNVTTEIDYAFEMMEWLGNDKDEEKRLREFIDDFFDGKIPQDLITKCKTNASAKSVLQKLFNIKFD